MGRVEHRYGCQTSIALRRIILTLWEGVAQLMRVGIWLGASGRTNRGRMRVVANSHWCISPLIIKRVADVVGSIP